MGKVIAVMNQKGGVGKSVICNQLAIQSYLGKSNADRDNNHVCIYDSDEPQFSVARLRKEEISFLKTLTRKSAYTDRYEMLYGHNVRKPMSIFHGSLKDFTKDIDKLKEHFEYIYLDVVGTLNTDGLNSALLSKIDLIVIPTTLDDIALASTYPFIQAIEKYKSKYNYQYCVLFNKVSRVTKQLNDVKDNFDDVGVSYFDTLIRDHKYYADSYILDTKNKRSTIFSFSLRDFIALDNEVMNKLK